MKPVAEVRQETAEVLGNAVAEVARRAIRPELDPFKQSLDVLVGDLEEHAEAFHEQVRAEKKALDTVNKHLGEVVATCESQALAVADALVQVQKLYDSLDRVAGDLASTREEHAKTVAAMKSLSDDVLVWRRANNEQAELLESVISRVETLTETLGNQASAFSDFSDALADQIDARTREVLHGIEGNRSEGAYETSNLRIFFEDRFNKHDASSRAAANELGARVDTGAKSITDSVASAFLALKSEIAGNGVAHQLRHDEAAAEMRALVEALHREMAAKIGSGFLHALEKMESGSQRTVDDVARLRITAESKLASLCTELECVFERLSAKHEEHLRELVHTRQTAGRVVRLAVANLVLVLIALVVGGGALWMAVK